MRQSSFLTNYLSKLEDELKVARSALSTCDSRVQLEIVFIQMDHLKGLDLPTLYQEANIDVELVEIVEGIVSEEEDNS